MTGDPEGGGVVIVDDDPSDRLLVRRALRDVSGCELASEFADGPSFLAYFEGAVRLPDAVLLDLNMPGMSGFDVLARLREMDEGRRVVVVVFSTSADPVDVGHSYEAGANAFLTKPFTYEGLKDMMRAAGDFWFRFATLPPQ